MQTLSTVILSIKGEARKANLQYTELTVETLKKYFKKKDEPEQICCYEYDDKFIFVFGYKKGKKGTENKTELPEPYTTVLYGDAIVLVSMTYKWELAVPFTVDQWNAFYNYEDKEEIKDDKEEDEIYEEEIKDECDTESEVIVEEEEEEEVKPVRKRRAPAYTKVDANSLKEEISLQSEPESHPLRISCINNLAFLEQFSKSDIRSLEKSIYEAAFNYSQKNYVARSWKSPVFMEIYRQNVRAVFSNIHPESPVKNHRLLARVMEGEFKLQDIPSMTSYEMFPEKWFELKDKLLQREQKILEGNKSRATDQFKCRRCQKRECTYYELQTRSADEPMTIFITCLNCGKEWRQGG